MAEMEAQYGSGRRAAKAAGIPESTWRGMKKVDRHPKPATAEKLERVTRETLGRHIRNEDIKIKVRQQGDRKDRTLTAKNLKLGEGAADAIRQAYVEGGSEAAAKELINQTRDHWYKDQLSAEYSENYSDDYGYNILSVG
jgi:hypothetical protein